MVRTRPNCLNTPPAALTVLLINLDHQRNAAISLTGIKSQGHRIYQLTSPDIFSTKVLLNGSELKLAADGSLPLIKGNLQPGAVNPGVTLNPLSYCFVIFKLL